MLYKVFAVKPNKHTNGIQQQPDQLNKQLFRQDIAYITLNVTTLNNTNMNPLKTSNVLFGSKTWHMFINFLCILCSQSGINILTKSFTAADIKHDKSNSKSFSQCLSSHLNPDKLQPPPWQDTCSFEMGQCYDDRYNGSRHLAILLLL